MSSHTTFKSYIHSLYSGIDVCAPCDCLELRIMSSTHKKKVCLHKIFYTQTNSASIVGIARSGARLVRGTYVIHRSAHSQWVNLTWGNGVKYSELWYNGITTTPEQGRVPLVNEDSIKRPAKVVWVDEQEASIKRILERILTTEKTQSSSTEGKTKPLAVKKSVSPDAQLGPQGWRTQLCSQPESWRLGGWIKMGIAQAYRLIAFQLGSNSKLWGILGTETRHRGTLRPICLFGWFSRLTWDGRQSSDQFRNLHHRPPEI